LPIIFFQNGGSNNNFSKDEIRVGVAGGGTLVDFVGPSIEWIFIGASTSSSDQKGRREMDTWQQVVWVIVCNYHNYYDFTSSIHSILAHGRDCQL